MLILSGKPTFWDTEIERTTQHSAMMPRRQTTRFPNPSSPLPAPMLSESQSDLSLQIGQLGDLSHALSRKLKKKFVNC